MRLRDIAFAALVLGPVVAMLWLGIRVGRGERASVQAQFHDVLLSRLNDHRRGIATRLEAVERHLVERSSVEPEPAALRELAREDRYVRGVLLRDSEGRVLHPPLSGPSSDGEQALLRRILPLLERGDLVESSRESQPGAGASRDGFHPRFWDNGLVLLYSRVVPQRGLSIIFEVDRMGLLADILAALPADDGGLGDARVALTDQSGEVLYQWGGYEPGDGEAALATLPLAWPLGSLALRHYGRPPSQAAVSAGWMSGVAAMIVALLGVAVYFHRENARELREAAQRVSFVDKVSHELKTPLTNVRMYAELLERGLDDDAGDEARGHVRVIVSESERLSRLITNVLTLSKQRQGKLSVQRVRASLDDVVARTLDAFRPALAAKGVVIELALRASEPALLDDDAAGQILQNLIGNVERYGAAGKILRVETTRQGDQLIATVSDAGPGIDPAFRARIFEPFHQVGAKLSAAKGGTGIGLGIARDLARLHGGDLELVPSAVGACFRVTLDAPRAPGEAA